MVPSLRSVKCRLCHGAAAGLSLPGGFKSDLKRFWSTDRSGSRRRDDRGVAGCPPFQRRACFFARSAMFGAEVNQMSAFTQIRRDVVGVGIAGDKHRAAVISDARIGSTGSLITGRPLFPAFGLSARRDASSGETPARSRRVHRSESIVGTHEAITLATCTAKQNGVVICQLFFRKVTGDCDHREPLPIADHRRQDFFSANETLSLFPSGNESDRTDR